VKTLVYQEEMVEVEVTREAQRAITRQSISALSVTSLVTSRGIVWRTMRTPRNLSPRSMRMRVLWWFVVGRIKKVRFLTLVLMPFRAVIVWRNVKHSTSAWTGGGKNTHGQSREAEVTILVINL